MKRGLTIILLGLFLFPIVSAQIYFGPSETIYNLGDDFNITVSISSSVNRNDFVLGSIVCGDESREIFKSPLNIIAGESKDIVISALFDNFLLDNLKGSCSVKVNYGEEQRLSQSFQITDEVVITYEKDKENVNPGESVLFKGNAIKKNGDNFNGFVEIIAEEYELKSSGSVSNGQFNIDFKIPEDFHSGDQNFVLRVYDLDNLQEVLNEGKVQSSINVNQIVKSVDVAINSPNLSMGDEIIYRVMVYDQSGEEMVRESNVRIYYPDGILFLDENVNSLDTNNFTIDNNKTPGEWRIEATVEGISSSNQFFINQLKRISYNMENETLIVYNVGNVLFDGEIEVFIGEEKETKMLNLGVGESKKFKLAAPKGYYPVAVGDGSNISALGTSYLTGRAISVDDIGSLLKGKAYRIFFWFFVIILLSGIGLFYYRKNKKKDYFASTPLKISGSVDLSNVKSRSIASDSVMHEGIREECPVIFLKIKNLGEIKDSTSNAIDSINAVVSRAMAEGGKSVKGTDGWTIVFSSMKTKEKDNSFRAIKFAKYIESNLNEHNKNYSQKIKFGIGVNSGELIVESQDGSINFVSPGSAVISAKRLAEKSEQEVLLSDSIRKKSLSNVKTEKIDDNSWKISRIVERNQGSKFIERFMDKKK